MLTFESPQLSDKPWVDELLAYGNVRGCDYNFTNFYIWGQSYNQKLARMNDYLLARFCGRRGCSYMYPAGRGDITPVLAALMEDAAGRGNPLRLLCLSHEQVEELEELFPHSFHCEEDRDAFDYLYDVNRLADLGGKKLHSKRNHIHRFTDTHPDWTYEVITPENMAECVAMDAEWYRRSMEREGAQEDPTLGLERIALASAFEHYDTFGLDGGLIRTGGEVVAFTIGDPISADTYDVHFEKAFGEMQGAFPLINREFARWVRDNRPNIKYLNRENDLGVPGLRRAKESYYPDLMVEKHIATQIVAES